jgi:hypothetical protein
MLNFTRWTWWSITLLRASPYCRKLVLWITECSGFCDTVNDHLPLTDMATFVPDGFKACNEYHCDTQLLHKLSQLHWHSFWIAWEDDYILNLPAPMMRNGPVKRKRLWWNRKYMQLSIGMVCLNDFIGLMSVIGSPNHMRPAHCSHWWHGPKLQVSHTSVEMSLLSVWPPPFLFVSVFRRQTASSVVYFISETSKNACSR